MKYGINDTNCIRRDGSTLHLFTIFEHFVAYLSFLQSPVFRKLMYLKSCMYTYFSESVKYYSRCLSISWSV